MRRVHMRRHRWFHRGGFSLLEVVIEVDGVLATAATEAVARRLL